MHQQKHESKDVELIEKLRVNDQQLKTPQPGDWLYEHKEAGQILEQYIASKPVSINSIQNKIYLLPLGEFTSQQNDVIRYTADYLQIFFGLKIIVSDPISDSIIPSGFKRTIGTSTQLLTTYIMDSILKKRIPQDAIVVMAITEKDLYPSPSWNYVFGEASLKDRVGVSSIFRYSRGALDSSSFSLCLGRLIKTASHEIGHMFSMLHCIHAQCVMNGSNNLEESDSQPVRLCSECLSKLQWNLKFDVVKRLQALDSFFLKHGLNAEHQLTQKDLQVIN
jgi:archaemetzincin